MATDRRRFLSSAAASLAAASLVRANKAGAELIPEIPGFEDLPIPYFGAKPLATSKAGMAICSNPWATRAAINVLKAGGNACDGALAASVTQAVVEPHMT